MKKNKKVKILFPFFPKIKKGFFLLFKFCKIFHFFIFFLIFSKFFCRFRQKTPESSLKRGRFWQKNTGTRNSVLTFYQMKKDLSSIHPQRCHCPREVHFPHLPLGQFRLDFHHYHRYFLLVSSNRRKEL